MEQALASLNIFSGNASNSCTPTETLIPNIVNEEHSEAGTSVVPVSTEPDPIPTEENTINILIIGETGVGKSTFINAFANYLQFENLEEAENGTLNVLIPCKFTVTDENYELREVKIGSDKNENDKLGQSATKDPRIYTFLISNGEKFVTLIDTPGIGDTNGIDQDIVNCENIIKFIAPLKVIHGILFLLKPNSAKITVLFEFVLKQILSKLEKSASNNLLFVFTNTRSTCYRPGETYPCLRAVLQDISRKPPYVNIPLGKSNIFCFDNEAFRYLAAIANDVQFTEKERGYFAESWDKSAEESWRMILHILGDSQNQPLKPHRVEDTVRINETRNLINQLKKPMADITSLIQDKIRALERQTELLQLDDKHIQNLRANLVIPVIDIEVVQLDKPVTVCTSSNCAKIYKVRDVDKWHYVQRCHNPCYLKEIPKEIIGAPQLVYCNAMRGTTTCQQCGCNFSTHMHIYYESRTVDKTIEDDNVKQTITTKEERKREKEELIRKMEIMKNELEAEHKIIINSIVRFAKFLEQNAITPYNDVFRQYLEYLIDRERSNGEAANQETISHLIKCQQEYDEAKHVFDRASSVEVNDALTPQAVQRCVEQLFLLQHSGQKIKEMYESQRMAREAEKRNNNHLDSYANYPQGFYQQYSSRIKNFFSRNRGKNDVESDEDNSKNESNNQCYYSFGRKKNKPKKQYGSRYSSSSKYRSDLARY